MKFLLDTHTFLWFVNDDPQISASALSLMRDPTNDLFISVASLWEIAIKVGIGKLPLAQPVDVFIPEQMRRNAIDLLPIAPEHTFRVTTLPQYHRDPFDRLLAAQSLTDEIPLLSGDTAFDAYGVNRVW